MTGDVGRDSYMPWLPLQTLPSLMGEILAKLQMLELHTRLALLIYLFAMRCVKFYASEKNEKFIAKSAPNKKTYETTKPRTQIHYLVKLLYINKSGANLSVKKTGSGFMVTKQLLYTIKTKKSF